ncbi:hypothetical protein [Sinomonas humi]|uniref:hypothetical protein n=1 Tax=Sinomonas humi TaxID=1338436 RepID=UPI0012E04498|nr:hypothetical protein [Sinomonas humi]
MEESEGAVDRNDGDSVPRRRDADLEHATVRELIVQLARVEEEGVRCAENGAREHARDLAERGRAIVQELRSRALEAELD